MIYLTLETPISVLITSISNEYNDKVLIYNNNKKWIKKPILVNGVLVNDLTKCWTTIDNNKRMYMKVFG